VKRDGLKKCTDIVRKKHLISEVESVSVILSDLCVLISEGIVFHLTFRSCHLELPCGCFGLIS